MGSGSIGTKPICGPLSSNVVLGLRTVPACWECSGAIPTLWRREKSHLLARESQLPNLFESEARNWMDSLLI